MNPRIQPASAPTSAAPGVPGTRTRRSQRTVTASAAAVGALLLVGTCAAHAHIGYTGRDFGSFTGLDSASTTIANQAVTGNFGWANAADGNLGDSHESRAFRFHLDNAALVSISIEANPTATAASVGGLVPGFSVYQGLAAVAPFAASQTALASSADHDESAASEAWRTTWAQENLGVAYDAAATGGNWNALGNWKIGGDGDLPGDGAQLSSFTFKGFGVDYDRDGKASLTLTLPSGDYSLFVGGNDLANESSPLSGAAFGLKGTVSVTAVPEPGTLTLIFTGAAAMVVARSRRNPRSV